MFFLSEICFLCLGTYKNLKLVVRENSDGGLIQKRLKYCLPEIVDSHSQISKYICSNCMCKLQSFYKFKQTCLRNNKYLKNYCQTSTDSDESYQNKLQTASGDQTLPTVGADELSTGENLDNGTYIKRTLLNNEKQCDDIVVKEEFLPSEDNADNEYYQECVKSIKCEPIPNDSDVPVSSVQYVYEDSKDSNSSSDENNPTNPEETDNNTSNDTSKRRFKCSDCHRAYTRLSVLKRHTRIHTGERPFKYQTCTKTFTDPSNLKRHKLTHTEQRPHECDVCHKTFKLKSSLIKHKRTHVNIRSFQCTHCNYTCTQASNLSSHIRVHTGEKPYQCHMCPFKSAQASPLKTHIRTHTGEKPYSCQHCQKSFTTSSHLGRHKQRHHPDEEA